MRGKQLGNRLRQLREYHHYTQEYVSTRFNIERPSYSNYECGKCTPPLEFITRLADFYQISLDDLLRNPDFFPSATTKELFAFPFTRDERLLFHLYRLLPDDAKRDTLQYVEFRFHQSRT